MYILYTFFSTNFLNIKKNATVPLTRAFKLYWFPCYKIKLFLPAVPLTKVLKLYSIFYFVRCCNPITYMSIGTISTLDLRSIKFPIRNSFQVLHSCTHSVGQRFIIIFAVYFQEIQFRFYSCTTITKLCHKTIILLRCFL